MSETGKRIRRQAHAAWRKIDGQVVIVTPDTGSLHLLNATGSFIWELLERELAMEEISEAVRCEFDVSEGDAAGDAEQFVNEMIEKNMMEYC